MGSVAGAAKATAHRLGFTLEEYQAFRDSGKRWCCGCKEWHQASDFTTDNTRSDGLARACRKWKNANVARAKEPVDKRRARRVVQMRVRRGKMPHPSLLACSKCGKKPEETGKRHEYHHHNGYDAAHAADVVALCSTCHSKETSNGR